MSKESVMLDDSKLAAKIVAAIKEVDAATATRNEKAVAAGKLLAEAHDRHPTEKAFENFLRLAGGVQIRRARELIAFALGRKKFEQHQIDNAAAQQRHRDKLKAEKIEREKEKAALPKPEPTPKSKPEPKQSDHPALRNAAVEENAAASAEERKKFNEWLATVNKAQRISAASRHEFERACRIHLPKLNEDDLKRARDYFLEKHSQAQNQKKDAA